MNTIETHPTLTTPRTVVNKNTPVIFLAGMGCSPRVFDQWKESYEGNLFLFDHRRHPKSHSDSLAGADAIVRTDRLIHALQQEYGPSVIIGHSYGGLVTQRVEMMAPDLVQKMVLLASVPPRNLSIPWIRRYTLSATLRLSKPYYLWKAFTAGRFRIHRGEEKFLRGNATNEVLNESGHVIRDLLVGRYAKPASCPTLVVAGEHDQAIPVSTSRAIAEFHNSVYPHCDFEVIPEGEHMFPFVPRTQAQTLSLVMNWIYQ